MESINIMNNEENIKRIKDIRESLKNGGFRELLNFKRWLETEIPPGKVFVRIGSHRAREKMKMALGYMPQGYYSWNHPGEWREVALEELEKLRGIKGITRSRINPEELRGYIKWD